MNRRALFRLDEGDEIRTRGAVVDQQDAQRASRCSSQAANAREERLDVVRPSEVYRDGGKGLHGDLRPGRRLRTPATVLRMRFRVRRARRRAVFDNALRTRRSFPRCLRRRPGALRTCPMNEFRGARVLWAICLQTPMQNASTANPAPSLLAIRGRPLPRSP